MNQKPTIGIIGFGIVGKAIQHGFAQKADFRIYDVDSQISENTLKEVAEDSDFIFVCVPTPMKIKTGEADISIVDSTIKKIYKYTTGIIIIKSTIPPGTTKYLQDKYPAIKIVYNPEFLTARSYRLDFINACRIIIGGGYEDREKVADLYRLRFSHTPIYLTDSTTAEMVKYTSNCFFCVKLSFFNEIYDICEKLDIDYNDVIKMTLSDGRIGNSHYEIPGHDGLRGFGGLCFPKDINALIYKSKELGVNPIVMNSAWKKNLKIRKQQDWLNLIGAACT